MTYSIQYLLWKPHVGTGNQGHIESHISPSPGLRGEPRLEAIPSASSTNLPRVPGSTQKRSHQSMFWVLSAVDRRISCSDGWHPCCTLGVSGDQGGSEYCKPEPGYGRGNFHRFPLP